MKKPSANLKDLEAYLRQREGEYGVKRLQRAADEIPNLEKLYTYDALRRAFGGDNAQALMTMNPADFEKFALRLGSEEDESAYEGGMTRAQYLAKLVRIAQRGGFADVPFLEINRRKPNYLPSIEGHEGRHRSRALSSANVPKALVQLFPKSAMREPMPRKYREDFIAAMKKELGEKRLVTPEGKSLLPSNLQSPEHQNIERRGLLGSRPQLPDIYADGGVINLAKGGSVNIGINVATDRKAGRRYADLIVDGHKSLESRNSDSLRPYVGKRVAIVRTGEGPAKAIGEITIGEPMVVNKKKFRALEDQHLVPEGSSFDINTPTKHLYPMHDPVRYDDERDVGHGIIARKLKMADGGTVQGGTMPTLAEMRAMLMKRGNPIELQSIGVNEAPGLSPKAYMPPDRAESFQPAPGGVATQSGMPIGGIDQSRMMPGQQLMPQQPGQAPGTSEQPGRSATGQPQGNQPGQQPSPPPTGFGPMGSMEAQPSAPPSGAGSNILSMTPQGRALNAIGPAQKPQGMARGGTAKMGNIPAALLNRAVYGNRYINEAATTKGEQALAAALSGVNAQMASGQGLYKQGDTTSRIPDWAMNKMGRLNPATYSALFPRTNSYFLPDYAEMDPTQFYHGQVGALDKAFVNAGKAASRDNPEYVAQLSGLQNKYDQMRLANQNLFSGGNTSEDLESRARQFLSPQNAASNNFQRQNANIPMAFDAARGDLTPEQAFALQQTMGGTYGTAGQGGISNAAQQRLDMIQNTLAGYQRDLAGFNPDQLRKFQPDMTQEQIDARRADLQKQIDLYGGMLPGAQQDLADWQKNYAGYQQQFAGIDPTKLSSADLLTQLGLIKKPGGMATGGSVKQQGVTMGSPKSTRMVFQAEGSGGVKGINVPRHMWEGSSGVFQKGTRAGQEFKTPGMKDVNAMRAKVYGSENRDPLTIGQIGRIHKDTLAEHFKKPIEDQVKDEKDALGRLREAGHIGKTANTLDESEKLDTVRHEHDEEGRTHVGYASKGVAGHALYTSGHGKNMKHHVINTCPGQTEGCGGGKDAKGIVDTTKGTCFAPVAEAQYPGAAIRRASHEQAKHDPAMTRDWILAHTGSIRDAANAADKKNQRMLFRPNVVDETDTSSRHVIRHLNEQRKQENKPGIIANSYGKTNELHDPENGYYVTHSNVGPKVKNGREISENIGRDRQRVSNTIMAANAKGVDFSNEQGNKTPPKGSYMVTNVKRGSPLSKKMQEHITHAKYWSTGRDENELSDEEKKEGPEGHYGPSGRKTTPEKAHYGHTTLNGRRYDYQKQHILHPRLVQVGENKDGTPHMIPTDSRFKDTEFLPKDRFKTKNGKEAGHILMTTPTESTSNLGHETSFTHHVDDKSIKHAMSNNGEYEIDKPEDQEKARGKEYAAPQPISIVKKAGGGSIESRHPGLSDDDFHAFPERNFAAQRHLAMRRGDDEARAERPRHAVVVHKNTNTMRHEMMTRRKG